MPGDFSAAAPFLVAATLLPGSELTIHDVGLNPRRTGLLDVLERMGARITIFNRRTRGGEPVGDLEVRSAELDATDVDRRARCRGSSTSCRCSRSRPRGARREHGRRRAGAAREGDGPDRDRDDALGRSESGSPRRDDGFAVRGVPTRPRGGAMDSHGDHRIAMLGAVAGLVSREGVELEGAEAVAVSFPGFFDLLDSVTQR